MTIALTIKSPKSPHHLWQCCTYTKHLNYESPFLRLARSRRDSPQTQTVWLTLKGEHKRVLSQKTGTSDRNNLNRHGHKQTQMENFVQSSIHPLCSEMSPASTLLEVPKVCSSSGRGHPNETGVSFFSPRIHFPLYPVRVHHAQHLSPLFLIRSFLQHNPHPVAAVLPVLQGVSLCGHLHPPILWHHTSLSCIFFLKQTVLLTSQRFGTDWHLFAPLPSIEVKSQPSSMS